DIFRDMSAKAEVGALLDDLVKGTVSMAQAANRAREIQTNAKLGSSGGGNTSSPGSGSTGRGGGWDPGGGGRGGGSNDRPLNEDLPAVGASDGTRRDSPREQLDQLQTLKAYNRAGIIDEGEMRRVGTEYIRANLPGGAASAADPWPLRVYQSFLDTISTVNFSNGAHIDAWFTQTTGQAFIPWFNATQANKGFWGIKPQRHNDGSLRRDSKGNQLYFSGRSIAGGAVATLQQRFTAFWDQIPVIYDPGGQIGLVDFLALMSIAINEVSGNLRSVSEIGSLKYMFEPKAAGGSSYNVRTGGNRIAYDLFNDADFNAAHQAKQLGAQLKNTTDTAWKGTTWPAAISTDPAIAIYVSEADFYKFRGRGVIQSTWRNAYRKIVEWLQLYSGGNSVLQQYRTQWQGQDVQKALTQSSNADWDQIFGEIETVAKAISLHSEGANSYLGLALDAQTLNGAGDGSIQYMGYRISGSADYGRNFHQRVVQMMDALGNKAPTTPAAPATVDI
ncbi:MAG TPA: hypothetical protein VJ728_00485, partial [Candidatus Binataceae bacterium]|nr:hypothetical protein [Candidatus Binataceae bacterium]